MQTFRADLHIHTVLSPCGSLEMSPVNIIEGALKNNLDIIAITDHNSTLQAEVVVKLGKDAGIEVVYGAEITTKEEIHCIALMPDISASKTLQNYLDTHRIIIKNKPNLFGDQVVVNANDEIIYEEPNLLISAIKQSIYQVCNFVQQLGGLFIPAHIDRPLYGLIKMLGFIPDNLKADAMEVSFAIKDINEFISQQVNLEKYPIIRSSDAHVPDIIGRVFTEFRAEKPTFEEFKMACHSQMGRFIVQ